MSRKATDWAMYQTPGAPVDKAVLMAAADQHRHDTGLCFPSAVTLGILASCSERTARECLKRLESKGYIFLTARPGRTPLIDFNFARPPEFTPEARSEVDPITPEAPSDPTPEAGAGVGQTTPEDDDINPGSSRHEPRKMTTPTPEAPSDEPGLTGFNQEEPGWLPSATTTFTLRKLFGCEWEIPDHWIPMFMLKANAKPSSTWDEYFVEWARYQEIKDAKIAAAKSEVPDQPKPPAQVRNFESKSHEEGLDEKLKHARWMLKRMREKKNLQMSEYWTGEIHRLENIKSGGGTDG